MLIIEGGRSCLYQWDVNQRLEVMHDEIAEVHFVNAVTSPALVCEVYEEDGRRFANIPNILLQQFWPVMAYGCCDSRVRDVLTCKVIRRERPADYAYTETEVKTFDRLEKRLEDQIAELTEAKESGEFDGVGIEDITVTSHNQPHADGSMITSHVVRVYTTDGKVEQFTVRDGMNGAPGAKGNDGVGITSLTVTEQTDDEGRRYHRIVIQWGAGNSGYMRFFDVYDGTDGEPGEPGISAYQYAQDGGYTGTEAEFAAKMAQEVYSKVETDAAIEAAVVDDEYELIVDTEITEDVKSVTITEDINKHPYSLKKAVIEVTTPAYPADEEISRTLYFRINDASKMITMANNALGKTGGKRCVMILDNINGRLVMRQAQTFSDSATGQNTQMTLYNTSVFYDTTNTVSNFGIVALTTAIVPAMTRIKIWGVRA